MLRIKNILSNAQAVSLGLILIAAGALGAALTAQYVFGLKPCTLCLYQRVPYFIIFLLGLAAFVPARRGNPKRAALLIALAAIAYLAGAAIAFYHNGVEQHWWASILEGCKVELNTEGQGAQGLLEQIMSSGPARCDQIPWVDPVLHLSMAAWNMLISGALAVIAGLSALLITRRANGF